MTGWVWGGGREAPPHGSLYYLNYYNISSLKDHQTQEAKSDLDMTEETTELPVSDLSEWSNQMMMAVMLSQQFLPYLQQTNNMFLHFVKIFDKLCSAAAAEADLSWELYRYISIYKGRKLIVTVEYRYIFHIMIRVAESGLKSFY